MYCEVEGVATDLPAENLRQEGLFVPTPEPLAIDREVELFLRSPAGEITLRALVVQVIGCAEAAAQRRSPGYGVLFLDLQDAQRSWITRTRVALLEAARPSPAPAEPAAAPARSAPRVDDAVERARLARKTGAGTSTLRTSVRAHLEAELTKLKARSPSEILGIASPQDVEGAHRAFLAISKRAHPHVYARFDSTEVTRLATEIFIVYKRAYDTLRSNAKGDAAAQRGAGSDPPRRASTPPPAPLQAATSQRPAARDPAQSLRPATGPLPSQRPATGPLPAPSMRPPSQRVSLSPNVDPRARRIADAELLLSSAVRHIAATRFEQADAELAKAAALAPERVDIAVWRHVSRARGHKARGRHDEALASYRKVLELDPQHREARELLQPAERKRGGLVGKWLGKGEE